MGKFSQWELDHSATRLRGMSVTAEPGLRERKKAATRQALHAAALRLAIEHGIDRVTVEAIADEAGVSRRTFSNYFASKEEALLYGDHQRMRALVEIVRSRPEAEPPWTALTRSAEQFYRELGDPDPQLTAQVRLVRSQPALAAQQLSTFAALERELSAEVARRLPGDPSPVHARLTSAVFLTGLRVSLTVWLDQPPGTRLGDLVRDSLAQIGRGFA
jgi:AcrR family transcriptional regulator